MCRLAKALERRVIDLPDPGAAQPLPLGQFFERGKRPIQAESTFEDDPLPRRKALKQLQSRIAEIRENPREAFRTTPRNGAKPRKQTAVTTA